MKLKKRVKYALIGIVTIIIVVMAYFLITDMMSPVKSTVTLEAGSTINADLFIKDKDTEGSLKSTLTDEQLATVGNYDLVVIINNEEYDVTLKIEDTIAPTATAVEVSTYKDKEIKPEMFVKDIQDVTKVELSFKEEISTKEIGTKDITIILKDQGNNETEINTKLIIQEDTEAPVITGAKNISVVKGKTVSYKKGVTVKDNADEDIELKIDTSKVKLDTIGTYEVIYSATDTAGNKAEKTIKLSVINENPNAYTLENVYAKADAVLDKIITDSMTLKQKCRKIYDWVHSNVSYVNSSDKSSWIKAAMIAFNNHKGDCYNYFAITKALLTRADIENIDLKATKHTHFWNFVKVEGGWYHLDTTPRVDHPNLFLRTDAWMDAYSVKHRNCFSYDPSTKPASATK